MTLEETIRKIYGNSVSVERKTPVSGGDINRAYALLLTDGSRLFMKSNRRENADFFRAEAEGLETIRATGTIRVPEVIARGEDGGESFLLLEYIDEGHKNRVSSEELGRKLAEMHMANAGTAVSGMAGDDASFSDNYSLNGRFGFPADNYIGAGVQINTPADSWTEFFINMRLRPQFERASRYWDLEDMKKIERFLEKVGSYLSEPEKPSLIHGDLWGGNYMIDRSRQPWLIDPAAYIGHAEADIAMTELFGGFDRAFYDSYTETAGLDPGYRDRKDLYNLYHLLNHFNLFGTGYLYSVKSIIDRYL